MKNIVLSKWCTITTSNKTLRLKVLFFYNLVFTSQERNPSKVYERNFQTLNRVVLKLSRTLTLRNIRNITD